MVVKTVAELQAGIPAQLQDTDDAQAFKQFNIAVDGGLVLFVQFSNQVVNGRGSVLLQGQEKPIPRFGVEVTVVFEGFAKEPDLCIHNVIVSHSPYKLRNFCNL